MSSIVFTQRSMAFEGKVLIWDAQLALLFKTDETNFTYETRDGSRHNYTIVSTLRAILNKNFTHSRRKSDGKGFYILDKTDLTEV